MHLVNYLGHFPLGAGPSRLDSNISEHEDNISVHEAEELQQSIFNSPNVQVITIEFWFYDWKTINNRTSFMYLFMYLFI
jgi:hypothetical protein